MMITTDKKLIKLVIVFTFCLIAFSSAGCSQSDDSVDNPDVLATEQIQEIMESVIECDTDRLCGLFCVKIADSCDLESQVSTFMSEFASQILAYGKIEGFSGEKRVESGAVVLQQLLGFALNVETSTGEVFMIRSYAYHIHSDPDSIGVFYICAIGSEGNCFEIGKSI